MLVERTIQTNRFVSFLFVHDAHWPSNAITSDFCIGKDILLLYYKLCTQSLYVCVCVFCVTNANTKNTMCWPHPIVSENGGDLLFGCAVYRPECCISSTHRRDLWRQPTGAAAAEAEAVAPRDLCSPNVCLHSGSSHCVGLCLCVWVDCAFSCASFRLSACECANNPKCKVFIRLLVEPISASASVVVTPEANRRGLVGQSHRSAARCERSICWPSSYARSTITC